VPDPEAYGLTQHFVSSMLKKIAGQLEGKTVEGSSEDGSVCVVLSGKLQVVRVQIRTKAVPDLALLEKGVGEAVDEALEKVLELIQAEAGKLLGR
jgi:DNA-binding protein YbaB